MRGDDLIQCSRLHFGGVKLEQVHHMERDENWSQKPMGENRETIISQHRYLGWDCKVLRPLRQRDHVVSTCTLVGELGEIQV